MYSHLDIINTLKHWHQNCSRKAAGTATTLRGRRSSRGGAAATAAARRRPSAVGVVDVLAFNQPD